MSKNKTDMQHTFEKTPTSSSAQKNMPRAADKLISKMEEPYMENSETRVAVIGIVVENTDSVDRLNALLHDYAPYIIGRMGIPYPKKHFNLISIAMDAPQDTISSLAGKVGNLPGVSVKTAFSQVTGNEENWFHVAYFIIDRYDATRIRWS